jgi:hypothetical protein
LSYRANSKGSYGSQKRSGWRGNSKKKKQDQGFSQRDVRLAQSAFAGRSAISQKLDLVKEAPVPPSLEVWLRSPGNWDIPNVDLKLSNKPEDRQRQSSEIAQVAAKKKLELEVRAPNNKKAVKKFKILKKEEVEKDLEKTEEIKTDEYGRPLKPQMPTKEEIKELATELYKKDQSLNRGINETAPEPEITELREGGFLREAQRQLMQTVNNPAVYEYIENLKADLEQQGYTIVPFR